MQHTYVNLDFYNEMLSCKINNVTYAFSSAENFITKTNFPFLNTLRMACYEPERNIFVVEESNGISKSGSDLPEIIWIAENLANIEAAAIQDNLENNNVPSIPAGMKRMSLLYSTDWILTRWNEEHLLQIPHSITEEKFGEVLQYRQALRNLPVADKTEDEVTWPVNPLD
jgi:hypothetical protein